MAELISRSQRRREEFIVVWGVSPRCINKKRTVKTVINVQKVAFSPDASKSKSEEDSDIDDSLSATTTMFDNNGTFDKINSGEENNELETSIPNDLFELYIDANFSQPVTSTANSFSDINSTTLNTPNLDEIVPSIQVDDFLKTLIPNPSNNNNGNGNIVSPILQITNQEEEHEDLHNMSSKDIDNLEEIDMEMEPESRCTPTDDNQDKLSIDTKYKNIPFPELSLEPKELPVLDTSVNRLENGKDTSFVANDCLDYVNVNDEKKIQKSVRFANATPTENIKELQSRLAENPTSEPKASPPKQRYKRRSIQVQIPVHFKSGYVSELIP